MHEMALCQGVMEALEQAADEQGFRQVLGVHLQVGKLVALEKSQFIFSFELLSKNTLAENARVDIEEVEGKAWCPHCDNKVPINNLYSACPVCRQWGLEIIQGKELKIDRLEVC